MVSSTSRSTTTRAKSATTRAKSTTSKTPKAKPMPKMFEKYLIQKLTEEFPGPEWFTKDMRIGEQFFGNERHYRVIWSARNITKSDGERITSRIDQWYNEWYKVWRPNANVSYKGKLIIGSLYNDQYDRKYLPEEMARNLID